MILFPNAKINIGLHVTGRRTDGYHDLETVFYPVGITDALELVKSSEFKFTTSGIPFDGDLNDNLCIKAYQLISADVELPPVHMHLHKRIPVGAGLGGGSADAAFCIRLLNEQFTIGLTLQQQETYARKLGADCAFFIRNQAALGTGKGDELSAVPLSLRNYHVIVVMPPVAVSTASAYQAITPKKPAHLLNRLIELPVNEWQGRIVNDFEPAVFGQHPQLAEIKHQLYSAGALYASMSGSGSALYGIFKNAIRLPALEAANQVFYAI